MNAAIMAVNIWEAAKQLPVLIVDQKLWEEACFIELCTTITKGMTEVPVFLRVPNKVL